MPSSIPRSGGLKYCKVCFENKGEKFWMDRLGDKIKCSRCGREVQASRSKPLARPLRSIDPVRFRTAGGGFGIGRAQGSGRDGLDTWETPAPIRKPEKKLRQTVGKFPQKPDFDIFHNQESYRIIIALPYHQGPEDIQCEVVDRMLIVKSLLAGFDFLKEYQLPEDISVSAPSITFKNGILEIYFKKQAE